MSESAQKTIVFTDHDEGKLNKAVYEYLDRDAVKNYITNSYPAIVNKTTVKTFMITINSGPECIYLEQWSLIQSRRNNLHTAIEKLKDIFYIASTIEHHHQDPSENKNGTKKKVDLDGPTEIYNSLNTDQFNKALSRLKQFKFKDHDLTIKQKGYVIYNFFHYLRYRALPNGIADSFLKEIDSYIEIYSTIKDDRIFSDHEQMLISLHKNYYYTTLGFPHLHIAVGFNSTLDETTLRNELTRIVELFKISPDFLVDPTLTEKSRMNGNSIQYILKNSKNGFVHSMLNNKHRTGPIILVDVCSSYFTNVFSDFFLNIGSVELIIDGKPTGRKASYRPLGFNLRINKHLDVPILKSNNGITHLSYDDIQINPTGDKYHLILGAINNHMKEKQLVMCDKKVYRKRPNTRMTYEYYSEPETLYDIVTDIDPHSGYASKFKTDLVNRMIRMCEKDDSIRKPGSTYAEFPVITIDYRMLEFKDFFINTLTRKIYMNQSYYYCYFYSPVSYNEMINGIDYFLNISIWIKILKNSGLFDDINIIAFYSLLIPPIHKCPNPLLYGASDSGKSALIKIFKNLYPDHLISILGTILSEHHIHDQVPGKLLIIADECNYMLRSTNESLILNFLENNSVVSNEKHGSISTTMRSGVIIGTMNPKSEDKTFANTDSYTNRLFPMGPFQSFNNNKSSTGNIEIKDVELDLNVETGPVIFYCIRVYQNYMMKKDLDVIPTMTENDKNEIERVKTVFSYELNKDVNNMSFFSQEWKDYKQNIDKTHFEVLKSFGLKNVPAFRSEIDRVYNIKHGTSAISNLLRQ